MHFLQVGQVDRHVAHQMEINTLGVPISYEPYVSHADAIAYMQGADLLYLPTSHDCMPGKSYEYLRSQKPVLGLGAPGSHLHRLIAETGGGHVVPHDDFRGIARVIERAMTEASAYRPARRDVLSAYSREAGTRRLARLLDRLTRR